MKKIKTESPDRIIYGKNYNNRFTLKKITLFLYIFIIIFCLNGCKLTNNSSGNGHSQGYFDILSRTQTQGTCYSSLFNYDRIYIADGNAGISIYEPFTNFEIIDFEDNVHANGTAYEVVISDDNYAYVADGPGGIAVIDLSGFAGAEMVNVLSTYNAYSVKYHNDFLYVADGAEGLKIFDCQSEGNEYLISEFDLPFSTSVALSLILIDEYVYIGTDSGIVKVDVSDPWYPDFVSELTSEYVYDLVYDGRFLFTTNSSGISVYDLTQENWYLEYSSSTIFAQTYSLVLKNNILYAAAGINGLHLIDITDPANPYSIDQYQAYNNEVIYDVQVRSPYIFLSAGEAGLIVMVYDE